MKQFNKFLKEYRHCKVDMFNLEVGFFDYHNDISFDDVITINFNENDIPLSQWDNNKFLQFIDDIESNKECEFRYGTPNLDYFIYRNGILTYSINDGGVVEWNHELIFEPEYIPCLKKMHQDIDKHFQFINNRSPEEKQKKIDRDKQHEEWRKEYQEERKREFEERYNNPGKLSGAGIMALIANGSQDRINL